MCTVVTINNDGLYFGRNMDLDYHFNEQMIVTPRNYKIEYKQEKSNKKHYSIIGIGTIIDNYPLYADACNEKGLCMAGLNFKGYASYSKSKKITKKDITPYELILYILSTCKDVESAINYIDNINLIEIAFKQGIPMPTLHWIISDSRTSIVVEYTKKGCKIYNNPVGVLTNNPTFDFHITNISNYMSISNKEKKFTITNSYKGKKLSNGSGGFGLPGDSSSTSRFIRAVFLKNNIDIDEPIISTFHILDNLKVLKGQVINEKETSNYTIYSGCIDSKRGIYYYKTYTSYAINKIAIDQYKEKEQLISFQLK